MRTKEEIELRTSVLIATLKGLIGYISVNVRMITIDWSKKHYHIKAYFDRPTTDDDLDDFQAVSAEVLAHFPEMIDCKEEVIFSEKPIEELNGLKEMVFLRKGEIEEV
jgi:hypothetical protein